MVDCNGGILVFSPDSLAAEIAVIVQSHLIVTFRVILWAGSILLLVRLARLIIMNRPMREIILLTVLTFLEIIIIGTLALIFVIGFHRILLLAVKYLLPAQGTQTQKG